jgi:hypothetical protein
MVSRACITRFLIIVFASAEMFVFFLHFRVCSAIDAIVSAYAQSAVKRKSKTSYAWLPSIGVWQCHNLLKFRTIYLLEICSKHIN